MEEINVAVAGRVAGVTNVQYEDIQRYRGSKRLAWFRIFVIPITSFFIGFLLIRIDSQFNSGIRYGFMCVAIGSAFTITRAVPYGLFGWISTEVGYHMIVMGPFLIGALVGLYDRLQRNKGARKYY